MGKCKKLFFRYFLGKGLCHKIDIFLKDKNYVRWRFSQNWKAYCCDFCLCTFNNFEYPSSQALRGRFWPRRRSRNLPLILKSDAVCTARKDYIFFRPQPVPSWLGTEKTLTFFHSVGDVQFFVHLREFFLILWGPKSNLSNPAFRTILWTTVQ